MHARFPRLNPATPWPNLTESSDPAAGAFASFPGLSIIGTVGWILVAGFNWLFGLP